MHRSKPPTQIDKQQTDNLPALLEQHLAIEAQLAASLDELNHATANILHEAGLRGPSAHDLQRLVPITKTLQQSVMNVRKGREVLLLRVNASEQSCRSTIKQIIELLPESHREKLDGKRREILQRCNNAQTALIQNQASLFYTYDFHRKYLAGVLGCDPNEQNYRSDGGQQDVQPGNLYGKTC